VGYMSVRSALSFNCEEEAGENRHDGEGQQASGECLESLSRNDACVRACVRVWDARGGWLGVGLEEPGRWRGAGAAALAGDGTGGQHLSKRKGAGMAVASKAGRSLKAGVDVGVHATSVLLAWLGEAKRKCAALSDGRDGS
jgi:hypothetical protein